MMPSACPTRLRPWFFSALLAAPLLVGCAGATGQPQSPAATAPNAAAPPRQTNTNPQVISSGGQEGTAAELFEKGKRLLMEEKFAEAAAAFDLVQNGDPDPKLAAMALVQAGLAHEGAGSRDAAMARYQRLIDGFPKDDLVKTAALRKTRLAVQLERWAELSSAADLLLARPDLTVSEQIEALGAKALGVVEAGGDTEAASRSAERARTLMEKHHIGEAGRIPNEAAQVFFALGEVRRVKSELIKFDPAPASFGVSFEERSLGLLDAQSAYTDAMRTTDPYWATWAGYRVGQLYQQLHRDVTATKLPEKVKSDKDKNLFEGALQLRYRILLEKGLKMMRSTVKMNERVGETNAWGQRAREAMAQLEKEIAAANAVIQKVGVPEETLKLALEKMGKAKLHQRPRLPARRRTPG